MRSKAVYFWVNVLIITALLLVSVPAPLRAKSLAITDAASLANSARLGTGLSPLLGPELPVGWVPPSAPPAELSLVNEGPQVPIPITDEAFNPQVITVTAGERGQQVPPAGNGPLLLSEQARSGQTPFASDRLLVKFRPGAQPTGGAEGVPDTGQASLDWLLAEHGVRQAERLFQLPPALQRTRLGQAVEGTGLTRVYRLQLEMGSDVLKAVEALAANPGVEYAEPDYLGYAAGTIPDDPLFPGQWALAQIQAPAAWDVVTGTPAVVIAVLDTGIDTDHPDLAGRLWANPGETPGNGLDDDGNGKIDDVRGWNFVAGTNEVDDDDGHGTRVAGAAVAETGNGAGVAGVCWNCRLMAVKVMQAGGVANYSDLALGVVYAAAKGAEVINLSLGGYANSNTLREAVEAAAGLAVIVAAAGDDQSSAPFYPAAYPDVLAVGGTTVGDARASFSNYGDWVDVAAPSVAITTTLNGGSYGPASGTSLAAPLASGLAGLVWSQHPLWSPALVRAQVLHTTDAISDPQLGSGRINAANAVTVDPHPLLSLASTAVNGDPLGRPAPGTTASLAVTLGNDWLDAADVVGTLATADPYVTVLAGAAAFGDIPAGGTGASGPAYSFEVASAAGYNHPIPFTLHLEADGGAHTATLPFTITTVSANQNVCGTIASNQVWTSDKTYIITCNVGVAPGYTLTIHPGTTVKFNGNYSLNVGGTLIADGTESQPIRFTSNTGSPWGRIYFDDTSVDATADATGTYESGSLLRWVVVEDAGQGIGCNGATPYLDHVTTDGGGLACHLGLSSLWLRASDLSGDATVSANSMVGRIHLGGGSDMAVLGDYGYVVIPDGLRVVDISDPANPALVGSYNTAEDALGVAVAGGFAYVANRYSGLRVLDVSDPTHPAEVGFYNTPGYATGVAVSGGYVFVADGSSGLRVIDVSDPAHPAEVGFHDTPGYAQNVAVSGGYAFVADGISGLRVVAVSDPANPTEVGFYATLGPAIDVAVSGSYAYVVDFDFGLHVVDVSVPALPVETGSGELTRPLSVAIWGTLAYVGTTNALCVVDASSPEDSSKLGCYDTPGGTLGADVCGDYVCTANDAFGLGVNRPWKMNVSVSGTTLRAGDLVLPRPSRVFASSVAGNIAMDHGLVQGATSGGSIAISGVGTVADTAAHGTISLSTGTAQGNHVTGGGITLSGSGQVLTNTITGGGISAGAGSTVRGNNVEHSPGWGISVAGSATLTRNRVVGSASGINASGFIQGNLIANSGGVGLQVGDGTVLSNTLTGIQGGAIVIASGAPGIHGNNLEFNTGVYDLVNNSANAIDASGNWWGTTDSAVLDSRIFDYMDDYNKGQVTYAPWLAGPAQTAPAYVRSITLTPESPVGIESVAFDVEFSRAMDTSTDPRLSFSTADAFVWKTQTGMPTARGGFGVAASSGKIYAVGGSGGGGRLATVEEYDPATDTWAARASMPTARNYLGVAAASNGKIYAIGGFGSAGVLATVEEYDPATDTWAARASMPTPRWALAVAAASNGKIYAIGGTDSIQSLATVEEYDPATDTWTSRTSMPTPRYTLSVVAAGNGKLYAIGAGAAVEEYDPATDTWATRASMPTPRSSLGVAAANGKLYAIGGNGTVVDLATVEEYDPATDTWRTQPSMPTGRYSLGAAAVNNKIYAIGGANASVFLATVEEMSLPSTFSSFYGGTWPASSQYHALYDVSALIPRGPYSVTVQGGLGTDGIEIAPNSTFTFTVDYIGDPDTSTPAAPIVRACAADSPTTLSAGWTMPPTLTVGLYRYAIGTAPGLSDVTNWLTTTLTSVNRTNLNLLAGQTVYVSVRARGTSGIWSESGVSNGVVAGTGGCPDVEFSAAPTSGMAPLTVGFTAQVTGTVTSRRWDFGDGGDSVLAAPAHTYRAPGVYTVTLDVYGPGGWTTVVKEGYIAVAPDTVPPSGVLSIDAGAAYVPTTTVGLAIFASDPSGLSDMRFSNDGLSYSGWLSYTRDTTWALASGDGPKTVYAQVRDVPGNIATLTDTITLDTTPPTAVVSALPAFVGTAGFAITWTGSDQYAGLDSFDIQSRAGTSGTWTDCLTDTTRSTAAFIGAHGQTYYFRARARDLLGNLGEYAPGDGDTQTTLDLLPPEGSVVVNNAAPYTNRLGASLTLSATDLSGVEAFQASNDGMVYSQWISNTPTYSWTLAAGDGIKTVYVRFRDRVGHESEPVTDGILLDTVPPDGALVIEEDAWVTASPAVTLALTATDILGVADMCLSNDAETCQQWEPFAASRSWMLPLEDGAHTVTARIRDLAGNASLVSDSILLDTVPPETGSTPSGIAGSQGWWQSPVQVSLAAVDVTSGVDETYYRTGGGTWLVYTTSLTLSVEGVHTIEYGSVDLAGNREVTRSLEVAIDTVPPTTTASLSGTPGSGGWYVSEAQVSLSALDDTSGVDGISYRVDGSVWQIYDAPFAVSDGIHTLEYCSTDLAGNQEIPQQLSVQVDTTPPAAAVDPLAPYQTSLTFPVSWSGADALNGIETFDVQARDGNGPWIDWLTATAAISSTFAGVDGHTFYFRARARDGLGNQGEYAAGDGDASTHVDTARPEGDIAINGGATDTTSRDVVLVLLTNGETEMALSDDGVSFGPWEPFAATRAYQLPPGDGLKTVYVRYCCDLAGQPREYSDTIVLNTSLPGEEGLAINDDAPLTEQVTVTLTLKAPPGTRQMMVSNSSLFVAAEWEPYAASRTWVLAYYPHVQVYQVYARFRSVDGAISERYDDTITLHLLEPPQPIDHTPPSGSLAISAGAEQTSVPEVTLDVLAADNPGGSGVQWVYFREWKYDPLVVQWLTVGSSGWLPYADSTSWTLASGTGVKYVGAWFADGANNVSNPVILDDINLVVPGDLLDETEVAHYRQRFEPGQIVTVTLGVSSGDADLYIWRPDSTAAPDYWSNLPGSTTEQLVFMATEGKYLIEVHGYASSIYTLDIATSGSGAGQVPQAALAAQREVQVSLISNKPLPAHPLVITSPGQAEQPGEEPHRCIYLPLVVRSD